MVCGGVVYSYFRIVVGVLWLVFGLNGQAPAGGQVIPTPTPANDAIRPTYILGPNDQILIRAPEADELSDKPFRVDADGFVTLPLVGKTKVSGLTIQQFEQQLVQSLRKFILQPQATVTVVQYRSEPVFFVGAFRNPGIYPLQGRRTLVEMLSAIGGLQPNASRRIKVMRRAESGEIPLSNTQRSPDGKSSTVEIGLGSLRENVNPEEDIELKPFDVITVDRAEMVYITGEVGRTGGFELGERDSISVAQAVTLAGGWQRSAKPKKARLLRPVLDTSRRSEIPLDLEKIFAGKDSDYPLLPNDVLYVPRASRRELWGRVALFAVPLLPTILLLTR
jgi:polysaccharide biosynthesis/export protein